MILGHDPSVRAGAFNAFNAKKLMRGLEIARTNRMPYVQFVESAGADLTGGDDGGDPEAALRREVGHFAECGRLFYEITELSKMGIPTISVVFGSSTAGGAYQPGMSDYNILVREPVAACSWAARRWSRWRLERTPTTRASAAPRCMPRSPDSATIWPRTNSMASASAARSSRHLNWRKLGPEPAAVFEAPMHDAEELWASSRRICAQPFDMREVIARIVDGSRFEEFKPLYGPTLVTGWAAVHGYPVGMLGNNGALLSESSEKAAQFIQLCNQIDVPLVFFTTSPAIIVGTDFEQGGITKNGSKMINAVSNSTVPHIYGNRRRLLRRRQLRHERARLRHAMTFIWPTAKIAVMGPKQMAGVMSLVRRAASRAAWPRV